MQIILFWGLVWGVFEATAGALLHLLPFAAGAYIWFPAAYFFMDRVYQKTGQKRAVVGSALLSAAIKLLGLFSAMRPDYVIHPAVSIVLEGMAMACVLALLRKGRGTPAEIAVKIVSINTLWRLGYALFLFVLAPVWAREGSAVQSMAPFLSFMIRENLLSSLVCGAVAMAVDQRGVLQLR